jgi:Methylamine utilisation protein MauE
VQAILSSRPDWVNFLIRGFFILLLGASALGKILDMPGFYKVVATYQLLPNAMIALSAWLLVAVEFGLFLALIHGKSIKRVAALVIFLHCIYLLWLAIALWRGLNIPNCGCFGVYFPRPLTAFSLLEDGFLLILSGILFRRA